MARLGKVSESPAPDLYDVTPEPPTRIATSNSVTPSSTSDKENQSRSRQEKGKTRVVPLVRSESGLSDSAVSGKRKRVENNATVGARSAHRRRTQEHLVEEEEEEDESEERSENDKGYDPDQDVHERRVLRNQLRDLTKELNDNRAQYLNSSSKGIIETLSRANDIAGSVKQTADATIDSRLLVTTADLSYRKTVQLTLGDSAQGVDVDEFVSKCISLMRRAGSGAPDVSQVPNSTQGHRRRTQRAGQDLDEEEGDDGDMLNWEALGSVILQYNSRPAVPGFLLGPLSFEKPTRKPTQRKAGLKISSLKETQPEILDASDIHKSENSNLSVLCARIRAQLSKLQDENRAKVEEEVGEEEDMDPNDLRKIMYKHGVLGTGGIDFFQFVINPYSFGQTIENMFYVSFLIRDGKVGIDFDDDGLPSLGRKPLTM